MPKILYKEANDDNNNLLGEVGRLAELLHKSMKGDRSWPKINMKETDGENPVKFEEMGREEIVQEGIKK